MGVRGGAQAAGLLESAFWPQWHAVLAHWLANSPDMDQVVAWFSGWKALLPQVRPRAAPVPSSCP